MNTDTAPRARQTSFHPGATDAERRVRVDLAACYRLIDQFGMSDMILNHISARVPGAEEHFLINPFGMMYEEITASCLIKVDLAGNVIHNPNADYTINLPGYVIHSAIHGARPDVGCVLHTHTPAGMAVSALECGLLPLNQTAMRFASAVAYHEFEGVAVDLDERQRLASNLGDKDVMILQPRPAGSGQQRGRGLREHAAAGAGLPDAALDPVGRQPAAHARGGRGGARLPAVAPRPHAQSGRQPPAAWRARVARAAADAGPARHELS